MLYILAHMAVIGTMMHVNSLTIGSIRFCRSQTEYDGLDRAIVFHSRLLSFGMIGFLVTVFSNMLNSAS